MEDKQVNILFFTGSIDWSGGTERSVSLVSSYLSSKNMNVKILSFFDGRSSFYDIDPKVELLSLHMQGKNPTLNFVKIVYFLRKLLLSNQIDVIVITDTILSLYVLPAILGTRVKTIYQENFNYFTDLNSKKRKYARHLIVKYVDYIITVSKGDEENYKLVRKKKGHVSAIYNVKPFKALEVANMDTKVVVTVGKLVDQKGYDLLLQAWCKVIGGVPDWKLKIIGEGVDEKRLKELKSDLGLSNSVEFVGKTNEVQKYYKNASLYVMSSRFEGFGFVLIEAKEFGLPIVSFDCPYGPGEVVRDGVDGLLAKPEDTDDLSKKLLVLMQDAELRNKFSQNALKDDRFEQETVLPKWEKVINDLFY